MINFKLRAMVDISEDIPTSHGHVQSENERFENGKAIIKLTTGLLFLV